MDEAEANIRESLLDTLSFLASETEQLQFATKVFYKAYQDEFACWWFDTFYPEEPSALRMFTRDQLATLVSFSECFDRELKVIGDERLTIEQLQDKPAWQAVVAKAKEALSKLQNVT